MFSGRVPPELAVNRLTAAVAATRASGRPLVDLTISNPTVAGFDYPSDLLAPLADPQRADLRAGAARHGRSARGGRGRLRAPGHRRAAGPDCADGKHERRLLDAVQAARRCRRRRAGSAPELSAARSPRAARSGGGPAVRSRHPRRMGDRRWQRRARVDAANARRVDRHTQQSDRVVRGRARARSPRVTVRAPRHRDRRRRGVRRLRDHARCGGAGRPRGGTPRSTDVCARRSVEIGRAAAGEARMDGGWRPRRRRTRRARASRAHRRHLSCRCRHPYRSRPRVSSSVARRFERRLPLASGTTTASWSRWDRRRRRAAS